MRSFVLFALSYSTVHPGRRWIIFAPAAVHDFVEMKSCQQSFKQFPPFSLFFVFTHLRDICPRRPRYGEHTERLLAKQIHRPLTSPPSLWPGRELRKYHYLLCLSSPQPVAIRLSPHGFDRSPSRGPGAPAVTA